MTQFVAFDKNVEVNGTTILSVLAGMGMMASTKKLAVALLGRNGLANIQPEGWYPQQAWLDTFRNISELVGKNTLFAIGKKIPENAKLPPEINSVESALQSIDVAYHMNHRHGNIGSYKFEKTSEKSVRMVCDNPYPCEFDRGLIQAFAEKFKTAGSFVRVVHDDSHSCRQKGGKSCTYLVSW